MVEKVYMCSEYYLQKALKALDLLAHSPAEYELMEDVVKNMLTTVEIDRECALMLEKNDEAI